jgi:DNA-binding CsgD family transcriptional regulator
MKQEEFERAVENAVGRMRERRQAEQKVSELARRDPETTARGLIVFAVQERNRLRHELRERFGFSVFREGQGFRCAFDSPENVPQTPERKARWLDALIALFGFEIALGWMHHASAYFPEPDRARKVCHAFEDAVKQSPALYNAFAADPESDSWTREYAASVAAAWARSHLKKFPGSATETKLRGGDWASELANAASLAWADRGPDVPVKRSTRFRDTLPPQSDGRRQKAPGRDLINLVDRYLRGEDVKQQEPIEIALGEFGDQAWRVRLVRERASAAGLTPRERELAELMAREPELGERKLARKLGVARRSIRTMQKRIKDRNLAS